MTTSSLIEKREPVSFSEGEMYRCDESEHSSLVVLCVRNSSAEHPNFEGVVIHPDSKSQYCIGRYVNCFAKCCFTNFHGEVVLKS